ncbi:MAG: hypothetical protein QOD99_1442 [Chthoniobacter sp.]|jgi:hypothetical protein|nr:hypothetical protein [Chthoniobacter sp.]
MKTTSILAISAAVFSLSAFAEVKTERTMTLGKIPAAAAQAIQKFSAGAKVTKVSQESDAGKTVYESTLVKGGRVREVSVDAKGNLVSDEKVIQLSEAPEAVRKTIEMNAAGGKVEKLEQVTEGGKETFEALIISGRGKREEIVMTPRGKVVEREDKTKEKDKD